MSLARRVRLSIALALFGGAAALSATLLLGTAPPASASSRQLAMIQDSGALAKNPARTLQIFRSLGIGVIRLPLVWSEIAAGPNSGTEPANPYPEAAWAGYDSLISRAHQYGIQVDLMPTGGAPLWAASQGAQSGYAAVWNPSAALYGQFVRAAAARYTGSFVPPGASSPLPRVSFWELWNEGNWGPSLAPQVPSTGSSTIVSAAEDRSLIDQAWAALEQTGHRNDRIVYASLSPDQSQVQTPTAITPPLAFLRTLYCLDSSYHPLTGSAAQAVGCQTPAGQFARSHPALFQATGIGAHPYGYGNPPTRAAFPNANSVEFAEIPQLTRALTRIMHAYGSHKSLAIYNTEYGYEPRPPQTKRQFPTPATAARYLNWAEYLSYKNPRIASYNQYLLYDGADWFTTGLISRANKILPTFYAFRLPIWVPVTSTRRGRSLEVWGCIRPAPNARTDTRKNQYAVIQFARGSSRHFRNLKTVRVGNPRGYIDARVKFPSSGQVRLAWRYPAGDSKLSDPLFPRQSWIYSRAQTVRLH